MKAFNESGLVKVACKKAVPGHRTPKSLRTHNLLFHLPTLHASLFLHKQRRSKDYTVGGEGSSGGMRR